MIKNLDKYWPGYAGVEVGSIDLAVRWLSAGTPLIFLAHGNATTWNYNKNGTKDVHTWEGGHHMVLVGVENNSDGPGSKVLGRRSVDRPHEIHIERRSQIVPNLAGLR
jgi:hypothetical protein